MTAIGQDPPLPLGAAKPWNAEAPSMPQSIMAAQGMIGAEERQCFYWLAKHCLSGEGTIVDAGAFIGSSTLCFAAGAADGGRRSFRDGPLVHAYDYFKAVDAYVAETIRKKFRPIAEGESYLDVFEAQTAEYRDMIVAHPGDFLEQKWGGDPIELLFIDIAKSAKLNAHAIGEFFPSLIPGRSVVIHQDYFHCWHPSIHVGMEYLADSFELVDEHVLYQSRVWRLVKPIPPEKIARLEADDLDAAERLALLDRLVERSSPASKPMIEAVRMWQRCIDKNYEGAKADMARMRAEYGVDGRPELWFKQAVEIEKYYKGQMWLIEKARIAAARAAAAKPGNIDVQR
jgi:hypothetical protein